MSWYGYWPRMGEIWDVAWWGLTARKRKKFWVVAPSEIEEKLGYASRGALIHRDDMVL